MPSATLLSDVTAALALLCGNLKMNVVELTDIS